MKVLQEIKVPLESVNDTTLTVVDILFKSGNKVNKGDILIELETSKTTFTLEAEVSGFIEYLCHDRQEVVVNETIIKIYDDMPDLVANNIKEDTSVPVSIKEIQSSFTGETQFSIQALTLMEEYKLSKEVFVGYDFVIHEDVKVKLGISSPAPFKEDVIKAASIVKQAGVVNNLEDVTLVPISNIKRKEIEYLSSVQSVGLNSMVSIAINTEGVFEATEQVLKIIKNSTLPLIISECSKLLVKYPYFNAFFSQENIALYKNVNIGLAVDINDKGLKVLKIPSTPQLTIQQIENEIISISDKYLQGQIKREDLSDITFTITDLSANNVLFFYPLINKGNSAILGISSVENETQRQILSLTFDHRVTSGKNASIFLKELKERVESYGIKKTITATQANKAPFISEDIKCYKCFKKLEDDENGLGFLKCISIKKEEKYICQLCLTGY